MSSEKPVEVSFDLAKFKELVLLMEQHGLTEIDLQGGDKRWRIKRGPGEILMAPPQYAMPQYAMPHFAPAHPVPPATTATPPARTEAAAPEEPGSVIRSPTVGTFYSASAPGEDPYVAVGGRVKRDTVVCIIEAMKVMNHITADVEGTVTEVLVRNGDAVEFNQPLFRVKLG